MKHKKLYLLIFVSFIVGLLIGHFLIPKRIFVSETPASSVDVYPYLARRIFLDDPNDTILNFTNLRENLRTFVNKAPNLVGIYFEYLPTGTTIGVNDRETFFAASLIKTPLVMEVMKQMENGEISEDEILTIEESDIDKGYGDLWKRGVGSKITINEAINLATINSDNTAYRLLRKSIVDKDLEEVFSYLDIPQEIKGPGGGITPKNYSSILRSLYFSAYLSYDKSNELLKIMSIPYKDDLLGAKLPKEVKVSNKFGVYFNGNAEEEIYSDCGIVYIPRRNYTLCIMVQGATSPGAAKKQIIDISETVYEFITDSNPSSKK